MKIYLANQYQYKDETAAIAKQFQQEGFEITSTWLDEPHAPSTTLDQVRDAELAQYAQNDLNDIAAADVFVAFSVEPTTPTLRGGRHVELGFALGLGMPIFVVGPKENIFHYLPRVRHVASIDGLIAQLLSSTRSVV